MDTATNIFGVGHMTQIDGQYGCTGMSHPITLEGVHFFVTMMKTVSSMSISKAIAILENFLILEANSPLQQWKSFLSKQFWKALEYNLIWIDYFIF